MTITPFETLALSPHNQLIVDIASLLDEALTSTSNIGVYEMASQIAELVDPSGYEEDDTDM